MDSEEGLSRRRAPAVSAAAGCVALSGGVRSASAQAEKRITHLGAVNVKIAGIPVPVPKK